MPASSETAKRECLGRRLAKVRSLKVAKVIVKRFRASGRDLGRAFDSRRGHVEQMSFLTLLAKVPAVLRWARMLVSTRLGENGGRWPVESDAGRSLARGDPSCRFVTIVRCGRNNYNRRNRARGVSLTVSGHTPRRGMVS